MKKILIPIDFSEYSQCATNYACQMIKKNNSKHEIDLLYVFINHSNLYANHQVSSEILGPEIKKIETKMLILQEDLKLRYPEIKTNTYYQHGNLYEEVSKATASFRYDAVLMGTKGASGLEAIFIGSNTYDVIANAKTPVLAIPRETENFKKDRVALLCNFKIAEIDALQQAITLIGNDFELVLIHVNKDDRDIQDIDTEFRAWIETIIKKTGIDNISYTVKSQMLYNRSAENVSHAISNVLIDEQIDILLITKSRKSIFRKLIEENIVKKVAYNLFVPTLFARVYQKK